MKVYVIEFKSANSLLNKIISKVTGKKYTHSGMFFDNTFFELDPMDKAKEDYVKVDYPGGVRSFLKTNEDSDKTEAFEIQYKFSKAQIETGVKFWKSRKGKKYGYFKLLTFLWLVPLRPFMTRYYRKKGKPYTPKINAKGTEVCSVAVDKCLLKMGYDVFPKHEERTTYPGLFAEKLKKYKVKI